ncbi:MAG: GMC oxidoreductase, partial [Gammaproteobacteria bacterium]|nr:GMC oxidoreductase [Gammaproteobacteria bacterium]
LCQFGCPTGAKQSTLQSVVPAALARGASLISGARATRLLRKGDQVQGVCIVDEDGRERQVHARSTVLAMGSLLTPAFLQAQGVRLPWLGRNLSVHPAGAVSAWFPGESFGNSQVIPQGFGVSDLAEAGILFEGATPPLPALGALAPQLGRDFADTVDRYPETAWFGFMIRDTSRGQVRHIPGLPFPWVSYRMNGEDFRRFRYAQQKLGELFFAAGARSLQLPGYEAEPEITSVEQLRQCLARSRTPADFLVSAYHPLGTCRLGLGTGQGVCDPTHRVFGLHNLYVMDGSSVPSALGANPQVTIMALALRSARQLAERLSHEA